MQEQQPTQKRAYTAPRSRIRFSVRTLLLCFAGFAILCSLVGRFAFGWVHEYRVHRRLQQRGAEVFLVGHASGWGEAIGGIQITRSPTDGLTVADFEAIAALKQLHHVKIGDVSITDEMLAKLSRAPRLRRLDLSQNRYVTASGIRAFLSHATLCELDISGTSVSNSVYRHVLQSLPSYTRDVEKTIFKRVFGEFQQVQATATIGSMRNGIYPIRLGLANDVQALRLLKRLDGLGGKWDIEMQASLHITPVLIDELGQCESLWGLTVHDSEPHVHQAMTQISRLSNLKKLTYKSRTLTEPIQTLVILSSLEELELTASTVRDEDMLTLNRLPRLKILRLRNAALTTRSLEFLKRRDRVLDILQLPPTFQEMEQDIVASGIARFVPLEKPSTDPSAFVQHILSRWPSENARRGEAAEWGQIHVDYLEELLDHCSFPRPDNARKRPEDFMMDVYRQQCVLQADRRREDGDVSGAFELLKKAISDSGWADRPIRRVIAEHDEWCHHVRRSCDEVEFDSLVSALLGLVEIACVRGDADTVADYYSRLALMPKAMGRYQHGGDVDLELLMQSFRHCSSDLKFLRDAMCMVIPDQPSAILPEATALRWCGRNAGSVCLLVPPGKRVSKIVVALEPQEHDQPVKGTPYDVRPDKEYFVLDPESFPIYVELSEIAPQMSRLQLPMTAPNRRPRF